MEKVEAAQGGSSPGSPGGLALSYARRSSLGPSAKGVYDAANARLILLVKKERKIGSISLQSFAIPVKYTRKLSPGLT